jgi:hypothetical protein
MLHRVVCRLQHRQLACAFSGWAVATAHRMALHGVMQKAARRLQHRQLACAFSGWAVATAHRMALHGVMQKAARRLQHRQLACVFSGWILRTAQTYEMAVSADAEKMTANLVQQLDARSSELRQAHLAGVANEHHRQERMVAIGVARLRSHARAATFYAWLAWSEERRRLINLEQKFTRRWSSTVLAWAYVQWYEFRGAVIIEREHAEEEEAAAEVTAAASEAISRKAARRMGHLQIGAAFGSWQEWCVMRQHKVQMLHRVVCRLQHRQLACAFSGWAVATAHRMALHGVMQKAARRLLRCRLQNVLHAWMWHGYHPGCFVSSWQKFVSGVLRHCYTALRKQIARQCLNERQRLECRLVTCDMRARALKTQLREERTIRAQNDAAIVDLLQDLDMGANFAQVRSAAAATIRTDPGLKDSVMLLLLENEGKRQAQLQQLQAAAATQTAGLREELFQTQRALHQLATDGSIGLSPITQIKTSGSSITSPTQSAAGMHTLALFHARASEGQVPIPCTCSLQQCCFAAALEDVCRANVMATITPSRAPRQHSIAGRQQVWMYALDKRRSYNRAAECLAEWAAVTRTRW